MTLDEEQRSISRWKTPTFIIKRTTVAVVKLTESDKACLNSNRLTAAAEASLPQKQSMSGDHRRALALRYFPEPTASYLDFFLFFF